MLVASLEVVGVNAAFVRRSFRFLGRDIAITILS